MAFACNNKHNLNRFKYNEQQDKCQAKNVIKPEIKKLHFNKKMEL